MSARRGTECEAQVSTGGFTLVEVMVALVILAMGALALTHLSLSVAVLMQRYSAKTELIAAADNLLESVQARPYSAINAGIEADTISVRGIEYERRVTITAPNTRLRQIQIYLHSNTTDALSYSAVTYVSAP